MLGKFTYFRNILYVNQREQRNNVVIIILVCRIVSMMQEKEIDARELNEEQSVQSQELVESTADSTIGGVEYHKCSLAELIPALEAYCTKEKVQTCHKEIEELRSWYYKRLKAETDEARKTYEQEHNTVEGFVFESHESEFKEVYGRIKELRKRIETEHQKDQENNLQKKLQIIEKIEALTQAPESMNKTFAEFRTLQEEWKNTGEVPAAEEKTVWEKYHMSVGKFYDYVKIDRELRDLDQKRNYEARIALCEAAEKLAGSKHVVKAFADLQELHQQWRKIGPVKQEFKEQIWERFKEASTVINKAHQDYFMDLKKQEEENLVKKTALCEKIDAIIANLELTQKQWAQATAHVLEIQKEWKTIGYAPQKQNSLIYERFSKACDVFFSARKSFFGDVREVESENKNLKIALCEKAEHMSTRTDWDKASVDFVQLQKEWKKIGTTAFKDSQKLWVRFTAACNAFFDAKKAFGVKQDDELNANVALKDTLIAKVATIATDDKSAALEALKAIEEEWAKIQVPAKAKYELQKRFMAAVNGLLETLHIEKSSADDLAFRMKMSTMLLENGGEDKVIQEAKALRKRLSASQSELKSLENNIGFFSKTSGASKMISTVEQSIVKRKEDIAQIEQKIKIIEKILKNRA